MRCAMSRQLVCTCIAGGRLVWVTIDGCNGEGATSISCDSAASLVSSFTHLDTQSLNYYGCILIPHFPQCHTLCPNTHMRA